METFWQDLRFGFRQLLSKPGFAAIATLSWIDYGAAHARYLSCPEFSHSRSDQVTY